MINKQILLAPRNRERTNRVGSQTRKVFVYFVKLKREKEEREKERERKRKKKKGEVPGGTTSCNTARNTLIVSLLLGLSSVDGRRHVKCVHACMRAWMPCRERLDACAHGAMYNRYNDV